MVAKAIDDAVADGMDVINLSLGSYVTSYRQVAASSLSVSTIEGATRAGVIVVVAAGNSGPGATTIADYASAPDAIALGAIRNDRWLGNAVTVNGGDPRRRSRGRRQPWLHDYRDAVRHRRSRCERTRLLSPSRRVGRRHDRTGGSRHVHLRGENR